MVITPMLQKGQSVDWRKRPIQAMPDADKDDAVIVAVMRDGTVFLDTEKVTPEF